MTWRCEGGGVCAHLATWRIGLEGQEPRYLCAVCAVAEGLVVPLFGVRALGASLEDLEREVAARRLMQDGMAHEKKNAEIRSAVKAYIASIAGVTVQASSPPIMVSPDTLLAFQKAAHEAAKGPVEPWVSPAPLRPGPCSWCGMEHHLSACPSGPPF